MLIEFSVANFRSIKERQTFSFLTNYRQGDSDARVIDCEIPGMRDRKLLLSAAIYGANASGKSNFLKAIYFMQDFVKKSATELRPDQPIPVDPFRLDTDSIRKPSEFEMYFLLDGVRYQFGFSVTTERVVSEWMYAYPPGKRNRRLYERKCTSENGMDSYENGSFFKVDKIVSSRTRKNTLYLSSAAQFDHPELSKIYKYFSQSLVSLNLGYGDTSPSIEYTANLMIQSEPTARLVSRLIREADFGIQSVQVSEENVTEEMLAFSAHMPEDLKQIVRDEIPNKLPLVEFLHQGKDSLLQFASVRESQGTLKFFALIGPCLVAMSHGYTLFIDEIESSMHPLVAEYVVNFFSSSSINTQSAQLLFATHASELLSGSLLRRDQIWFTEKDSYGATRLYPLTDYKPRNNEALQRGYLAGRYGGIPIIDEEFALEDE